MAYEWLESQYEYRDEGNPDQSRRYAAESILPCWDCGYQETGQQETEGVSGWNWNNLGSSAESLRQFDWTALETGLIGFAIGLPIGAVVLAVAAPEALAATSVAGSGIVNKLLGRVGL